MARGLIVRLTAINETHKRDLRRPLTLPAVLNEFSFEETAAWQNYETVADGEFSTPPGGDETARMLRRSDLEVLTIDWDEPWLQGQADQVRVRRVLFSLLRHKRPFRIHAYVRPDPGYDELRMNAKLLSIRRRLEGGQAAARYWDLAVEEWRNNEVDRRGRNAPSRGRHGTRLPTTHRITAKTTFASLSRHYYGREEGWRLIAEENGVRGWGSSTPIADHRRFKVKSKVKIPEKPIAHINMPGSPRRGRGG